MGEWSCVCVHLINIERTFITGTLMKCIIKLGKSDLSIVSESSTGVRGQGSGGFADLPSASHVSVAEPRVGAKTSRQLAQCALGAARHRGSNGALGSVSPARTRDSQEPRQTPAQGHSFHDNTTALQSIRLRWIGVGKQVPMDSYHVPCSS